MQLSSVTRLLNKHGIKLSTLNGKLVTEYSKGEIPYEIKCLLHEREHELIAWLKHRDPVIQDIVPVKPVPRTQELPASKTQYHYWNAQKLVSPAYAYNTQIQICLKGFIDLTLLNHSLNELIKHYEILRTVFKLTSQGELSQSILPNYSMYVPLIRIDKSNHSSNGKVRQIAQEQGRITFDLFQGPLFRLTLLQLPKNSHIHHQLLFSYHQSILDYKSASFLMDELISTYTQLTEGKSLKFPVNIIEYVDYAYWEKNW